MNNFSQQILYFIPKVDSLEQYFPISFVSQTHKTIKYIASLTISRFVSVKEVNKRSMNIEYGAFSLANSCLVVVRKLD
jgi:hypothetical protein